MSDDPRVLVRESFLYQSAHHEMFYRAAYGGARGEALVYKRAARRRYLAMLRIAEWSRLGHDQAKAARVLVRRLRERLEEALQDGERFRAERDQAREERDSVQGVLDAVRASHAQDVANLLHQRDQVREELDRTRTLLHDVQRIARNRTAEAQGRAAYGERLKSALDQAREENESLARQLRTANLHADQWRAAAMDAERALREPQQDGEDQ